MTSVRSKQLLSSPSTDLTAYPSIYKCWLVYLWINVHFQLFLDHPKLCFRFFSPSWSPVPINTAFDNVHYGLLSSLTRRWISWNVLLGYLRLFKALDCDLVGNIRSQLHCLWLCTLLYLKYMISTEFQDSKRDSKHCGKDIELYEL